MKKLACILLLWSHASLAADVTTCGQITTPVTYKYCITKTPGSTSQDVLFYFHGGGGGEQEWEFLSPPISSGWQAAGYQAPAVVTISFGPFWLLVERGSHPNSGLLDLFQAAIIPQMENLAIGKSASRRMLMGISMGGFNSVQVLAKLPPGTFAKALLACPAVVNLSPWASSSEVDAFIAQTGADRAMLNNIVGIAQSFVSNEVEWNRGVAPLMLAQTKWGPQTASLMLAVNQEDLTFLQGGKLLSEAATKSGMPVTTKTWPGGHCHINYSDIAEFLSH